MKARPDNNAVRIHPRRNVTLLSLLRQGARIDFQDAWQTALSGDTISGYINMYVDGAYRGCWALTSEGLVGALDDLHSMRADAMKESD